MNQQKIEEVRNILITIDDLLACHFLTLATRQRPGLFKKELEADLRFGLAEKQEMQLAG